VGKNTVLAGPQLAAGMDPLPPFAARKALLPGRLGRHGVCSWANVTSGRCAGDVAVGARNQG